MNHFAEKFFALSQDLLVVGTADEVPPIYLSPSWTKVLGWSQEELLTTKRLTKLVHPEDLERTLKAAETALAGQPVFGLENRFKHRDGSWKWMMWTVVFSDDDRLIYACARDISKIKEMESRLQQSEHRLARAQRIAKIGSWELELSDLEDMNLNRLHWSDEVYRIFGLEVGAIEVSDENFFRFVHPDDHEKVRTAVAESIRTGNEYNIEHRIIRPDGSERIVHERSQVVVERETGRPILLVGTVQDITEQKKLFDQVTAAQKLDSIGRLAGGIAHDFNNLLAAIYGNLEVAESLIDSTHQARSYIANIRTASHKATDLINQLLAFGRQQVLSPTTQDLNILVLDAEKILNRLIGKDIEIHLDLGSNAMPIQVDPSQFLQIVLNLAINSRDAMPEGGRFVISTSTVDTEKENLTFAKLKVSDTGCGMTAEILEKIYEPFYTTKPCGTGLGLSTVYGIVKQSDGQISVKSKPNHGTSFEILFPLIEE